MIRQIFVALLYIAAFALPATAQQDTSQIEKLKREVDALSREIEAMRLGEDVVVLADTTMFGLGPAASKVYRARPGVSLGGYGEVLLQKPFAEGGESQIDALRLIAYLGYKFTPKLLFNSEIEFEHASTEFGGAVSVEFAYLDWVASPKLGVRAGMMLVPMGFINELHEPPVFLGARRPLTESSIIPSTWRENGAGVFGEVKGLSYRAYVINGFDALGGRFDEAPGFSAEGFGGGRQSGSKALLRNPAVVGRVDFTPAGMPGMLLGGSAYLGKSVQTETPSGVDGDTRILEVHGQYRAGGLELRGLAAIARVRDVAALNALHGFTGDESIGEKLHGVYGQAGYDVLRGASSGQQLIPYVRVEKVNTQAKVPAGFGASRANNQTITTFGAMWKPILNIALKADFQINSNKTGASNNQLNASLGYLF